MRLQLSLLYLLLISAIGVLAVPAPTPAPTPAPISAPTLAPTTTGVAGLQRRAPDDYDPHITIDIPTIKPFSLSLDLPSNTCTPTVTPDANGYVPPSECNALYQYYPSFGAALAFSVLFGILMITHFVQATVHKAGFVWVILMSAAWECIGFLTRTLSTRNQQDTTLATITQLFILLSPLWVNAFDYMVLARMIHFFLPDRRIGIFNPSLLAMIFVLLDLGSFVIQLIGGGMAGPGADQATMMKGVHIYMGGIGIQQFFIVLFLFIAVQFHRQMLHLDRQGRLVGIKTKWRGLLYALYASLLFITVRIIYRLVEFSSGTDASNPIPRHEWYLYVFDAVPMWFAIMVWNVVHPGAIIRGPDAKMPPSPLRKIFCCACCCSCCKKRKHKDMQKIPTNDHLGGDEMLPLRERAASPYR
ncbi:protein RTA1 [Aspergillus udagawae]|nr:protein RTA1 [Aspergillus udagawae]